MKRVIYTMFALAATPALACVGAPGAYDIAVRAEPVTHTTTRTVCDQPAPAQDAGVPGWLGKSLGAIAGAGLGAQIGKGKGNTVAAASGAVIGSQIGEALTADKPAPASPACRQVQETQHLGYHLHTRGGGIVFVPADLAGGAR